MSGETQLHTILQMLEPQLLPDTFVFCTIPNGTYGDWAQTQPFASVLEKEGLTLIVTQAIADKEGLSYEGVFRCISLGVESSLEAVGLTACISTALTKHHICANVVAGYYHDHFFVPHERALEAVMVINSLAEA